ncbi:MAG TPA: ABC transporter permease [Kofleriaceae bacterium]|nr:ABC transporter permease [Kofleriaceae bacterium]
MPGAATSVERSGRTAVVRVRGDVVVPTARQLYGVLRSLCRRRDVKKVVVDFGHVGKLDSSGVAVVELIKRAMDHAGKQLALDHLDDHHTAAFELAPPRRAQPAATDAGPTWLEGIGDRVLEIGDTLRGLGALVRDTLAQGWAVATRRRHIPEGSLGAHILTMGADAVFIVGLLSFLLGMTIAFQGAVQLQKFGAGVFVSDMVGWSMVREFAPLITAIVLTGRTGAAIAAELGTMRVGSEIDALTTMGVSPIRFLVVPRMAALTFVQPALTLMAMFIGIAGGFLVTALVLDLSPATFWAHITYRVALADFAQGLGKSLVFAWIIGITACHLGLRARGDASSVGRATTRTVVVSIFMIVVVDAVFATIITLARMR